MNALSLAPIKKFSSPLQESKVFGANRRDYLFMKVHESHNMAFLSYILASCYKGV